MKQLQLTPKRLRPYSSEIDALMREFKCTYTLVSVGHFFSQHAPLVKPGLDTPVGFALKSELRYTLGELMTLRKRVAEIVGARPLMAFESSWHENVAASGLKLSELPLATPLSVEPDSTTQS